MPNFTNLSYNIGTDIALSLVIIPTPIKITISQRMSTQISPNNIFLYITYCDYDQIPAYDKINPGLFAWYKNYSYKTKLPPRAPRRGMRRNILVFIFEKTNQNKQMLSNKITNKPNKIKGFPTYKT